MNSREHITMDGDYSSDDDSTSTSPRDHFPTHSHTHSRTKSPTNSHTHSRTKSPTHSRTKSPTNSHTHSRTQHSPSHSPSHSPVHSPSHSHTQSHTQSHNFDHMEMMAIEMTFGGGKQDNIVVLWGDEPTDLATVSE